MSTPPPPPPQCQVHPQHPDEKEPYHRPPPLTIVKHHIQPLGMGGADNESNWVWVCDTGHRNIHTLMGPLANKDIQPTKGTVVERAYAVEGYQRWVSAGRPGDPHAAYGGVLHHPDLPPEQ